MRAVVHQEPTVTPRPVGEVSDGCPVFALHACQQRQVRERTALTGAEILGRRGDELCAARLKLVA